MSATNKEKVIESGCWIKLPRFLSEDDKFSVIYTQGGEQTATYYRTRVVWAITPAALYGSINECELIIAQEYYDPKWMTMHPTYNISNFQGKGDLVIVRIDQWFQFGQGLGIDNNRSRYLVYHPPERVIHQNHFRANSFTQLLLAVGKMLPKTDKLSFQPDMMKEFAKTVTKFAGDPLNKFNSPNAMNAKELQENKVLLLGEVKGNMKLGQQINYITLESYLEDPKKLTTNTVVTTPEQKEKELNDSIVLLQNELLNPFTNWNKKMDESYTVVKDGVKLVKTQDYNENNVSKPNQNRGGSIPDNNKSYF